MRTVGIHDDPVVVENSGVGFQQLKATIQSLGEKGDIKGLLTLAYHIFNRSDVNLDPAPSRTSPGPYPISLTHQVLGTYGPGTHRHIPKQPVPRKLAYDLVPFEAVALLEEFDAEMAKCVNKLTDVALIKAALEFRIDDTPLYRKKPYHVPETWYKSARLRTIQLLKENGDSKALLAIARTTDRYGRYYDPFAKEAGFAALEAFEASCDKPGIFGMVTIFPFYVKCVSDAAEQKTLTIIQTETDTELLLEVARSQGIRSRITLVAGLRAVSVLSEKSDLEQLRQIADDENREPGCPGGKWAVDDPAARGMVSSLPKEVIKAASKLCVPNPLAKDGLSVERPRHLKRPPPEAMSNGPKLKH